MSRKYRRHRLRHAFVGEFRRHLEDLRIVGDQVVLATAFHPHAHVRLRLAHQPRGGLRVLSVPLMVQRVADIVGVQRETAPQVALHAVRGLVDDVVADDDAPVVAGESEALDPDLVQTRQQLARDSVPGVVAVGLLRAAVALQIEGQHPELGRQDRHLVLPAHPALGDAVQEHHGVTVSHLRPVPSYAFGGFESVHRHAHRDVSSPVRHCGWLAAQAGETTAHLRQRLSFVVPTLTPAP